MESPQHSQPLDYGVLQSRRLGVQVRYMATIVLACLLIAGTCLPLLQWWRGAPVRAVEDGISKIPNVTKKELFVTNFGGERFRPIVLTMWLEIKGSTEMQVGISAPEGRHFQDTDHVEIYRLGPWSFATQTRRSRHHAIDVGPRGPIAHLIPFQIRSVDDLIEHYEELLELVEQWPRDPVTGRLLHGPQGDTSYFANKDSEE